MVSTEELRAEFDAKLRALRRGYGTPELAELLTKKERTGKLLGRQKVRYLGQAYSGSSRKRLASISLCSIMILIDRCRFIGGPFGNLASGN